VPGCTIVVSGRHSIFSRKGDPVGSLARSARSGAPLLKEAGCLLEAQSVAIVDDDSLVRGSVATLVRSLGLSAQTFASAEDYLQASEAESFACLITDVQMPGMSGLQLQKILAATGGGPPVIVMTAFADDRMRTQALERGALCFLEKPVDGDTLVGCLESLLGPSAG
jgi:FixJ family two-component response regulator